MRSHLVRKLSTRRQAQAGAALLLMMTLLAVGAAFMLLRALNSANPQIQRDQETYQTLAQAKEALINWAVIPTGGALGQLPYPDILDTIDEPSPDYNGEQDVHCPDTSSSVRPALAVASRCFGRLPWKTLNLMPATLDQQDAFGEIPWYAVSANLLDTCLNSRLNPALLNATYPAVATYNCAVATQLPHPWLVVRDHLGNILSNRVAFVLIMPRQKIGTQNRYLPLSLPRNYIDAVTVTGTCTTTCVAGTYDNGSFSPGNQFIAGLDIAKVDGNNTAYAHPYLFNDRLIYVTIDELMFAMEKRALQEARAKLLAFYGSKQYFPYTAAIGSLTGNCVDTNLQGFLPFQQGGCNAGDFLDLNDFPPWFGTANWKNFIFYAVGSACVPGTNKCEGSGTGFLKLGNGTQNTQAILIATGRPVANVAGQTPAMTTPPFAASLTRAQTGCCSTLAIDYLDSTANADGNEVFDALGLTRSTIYNDYISVVAP